MPLHDWSKVPSGLFHDFHQTWSIYLKKALNSGLLPKGLSALVEQRAGAMEGDVLTIETRLPDVDSSQGGVVTLQPPNTRLVRRSTNQIFANRANRIVVKHHLGRIVAVIEIVSPGNKDSRASLRDFVDKAIALLKKGVHLLVIDLFPPTPRDSFGIHKAIWDEIVEEDFTFPAGKDRVLASYESGAEHVAYVEPITVGDVLPDMPLFLAEGVHIQAPLEQTYRQAWDDTPDEMQKAVETGVLP